MAKFTPFGWNQYGELVYRNTGRAAPAEYYVKGSTVYRGSRKVGQIGKGTKKQQDIIRKAATAGGRKQSQIPGRFTFENVRKARKQAQQTIGKVQLVKPPPTPNQIKNFGTSVKNMALLSIEENPALRQKIEMMDDAKLMQLYQENEMIFDVYFDYGGVKDTQEGRRGNKETAKNAQALIDVYEAKYGAILIQSTLV